MLHNPQFNWSSGVLCGWSTFCHCLYSALSSLPVSAVPHCKPPDLSRVPVKYDRALSLLPHRPYDCCINLLTGTLLPSSPLYNFSRPKQGAMESWHCPLSGHCPLCGIPQARNSILALSFAVCWPLRTRTTAQLFVAWTEQKNITDILGAEQLKEC